MSKNNWDKTTEPKKLKKIRKWYRDELKDEAIKRNNDLWTDILKRSQESRRRWAMLALFCLTGMVAMAIFTVLR